MNSNTYTPPMQGQVVVITGATSGIGKFAAEHLARMGARIVFTARDKERGEEMLDRFRRMCPGEDHRVHYADLSVLSEMKRVATEIASSQTRIDVLANNAGAMFDEKYITPDGLEKTFALNHMSYFVLTQILRDRLLQTPGSRIVNTSSAAHRNGRIDLEDIQMSGKFGMFSAYSRTKLYNILFTRELARQLGGTGTTANAFHPGFVGTRFGDANKGFGSVIFRFLKRFAIPPQQGAETLIYLASSSEVSNVSGGYFQKCAPATPTAAAQDDAAARALWAESERIAAL